MFQSTDRALFSRIIRNDEHVLQHYLPERYKLEYNLRPRQYNEQLLTETTELNNRDYIVRMLYRDAYWNDTRTDTLLSMNDTVKFMFIVQTAMYHYDMYVKVAYDNFGNKRRWWWWWWWDRRTHDNSICRASIALRGKNRSRELISVYGALSRRWLSDPIKPTFDRRSLFIYLFIYLFI